MNYREQVQRVLAVHHARIELGLSRAREQEGLVRQVGMILNSNQIPFTWRLNADFDAVFTVSDDDAGLLKYLFAVRGFDWTQDGVLSPKAQPHMQVSFEFEGKKP